MTMKSIFFFPAVFAGAYIAIVGACSNYNPASTVVNPDNYAIDFPLDERLENHSIIIDTPQIDTVTENFVLMASKGGMKEVEMGKMAQQKATNPRVRAYGAMMVKDHSKANAELKQIASAKKISLPKPTINHHDQNRMHHHKSGKGFDMDYINMMIKDHNKTISLFQRTISNSKDKEIKDFAVKTLPVIRMHLDSAKAIYSGLMPHNQ